MTYESSILSVRCDCQTVIPSDLAPFTKHEANGHLSQLQTVRARSDTPKTERGAHGNTTFPVASQRLLRGTPQRSLECAMLQVSKRRGRNVRLNISHLRPTKVTKQQVHTSVQLPCQTYVTGVTVFRSNKIQVLSPHKSRYE